MSTNPSPFEVRRLEDLLGELVSRPEEMMPCDLAQLHEALRPGGHPPSLVVAALRRCVDGLIIGAEECARDAAQEEESREDRVNAKLGELVHELVKLTKGGKR